MPNLAENQTSGPVLGVPQGSDARQYVLTGGRVLFGASGAVSDSSVLPSGFTATKETSSGTGVYSIQYPETVRGRAVAQYYCAPTLGSARAITGNRNTLGSSRKVFFQVYTHATGAAVQPTSGDYFEWIFLGER